MSQAISIKSILFDFDHTLGIDHQLEERGLQKLATSFCKVDPHDQPVLNYLLEFRKGSISLEEMLKKIWTDWNCEPKENFDLLNWYKQESVELAKEITPMPGAQELFTILSKNKIPFAIFSNGWKELQNAKARAIGFPGKVLTSEELAVWKPNPLGFQMAAKAFSMEIATTAYVGDSPEADVVGAKNAGMITIWADLENKTYPEGVPTPDFTIRSLLELPDIVLRYHDLV